MTLRLCLWICWCFACSLPLLNGAAKSEATVRLGTLLSQIRSVAESNPAEALSLAQLAAELAESEGLVREQALAEIEASAAHRLLGRFSEAMDAANRAVRMAEVAADERLLAAAAHQLCGACWSLGDLAGALAASRRAIGLWDSLGDKSGAARSWNSLGLVHWQLGQYPEALNAYFSSLRLREELGESDAAASTLNNLGVLYLEMGQAELALEFFKRAISGHEQMGNLPGLADALDNAGRAFRELGDLPQSVEFHQRSLALERQLGRAEGLAYSLSHLAWVMADLGNFDEAQAQMDEALAIHRQTGGRRNLAYALLQSGKLLSRTDRHVDAIGHLEEALQICDQIGARVLQRDIFESLSEACQGAGQLGAALEHFRRFKAISDELSTADFRVRIAEIPVVREVELQRHEMELLRQDAEIRSLTLAQREADLELVRQENTIIRVVRNFFVGLCLLGLIALYAIGRLYWAKGKTARELHAKNAEVSAKQEELVRARQRLSRLVEANIIGILFMDAQGRIFEANDALLVLLGRSREDLQAGRLDWRSLGPDQVDPQVFAQLQTGGACDPFEKQCLRGDGSKAPVLFGLAEIEPGTQEYIGFALDLSALKAAEQRVEELNRALTNQLSELQAIFDAAPVALAVARFSEDGLFRLEMNSYAAELLRLTPAQVVALANGKAVPLPFALYRHGRAVPIDWTRSDNSFSMQKLEGAEFDIRFERGEAVPLLVNALPFLGEGGSPQGAVMAAVSISEQKAAEGRLRLFNQKLERRVAERSATAERRATQLQALAAELAEAEERERRRLAEVMHDHLQQILVGARFRLATARLADSDRERDAEFTKLDGTLSEAISVTRSMIVELSPPVLYDEGLMAALRWQAARVGERYGLPVEVDAPDSAEPETEAVKSLLFQAVRELLFNVVKHAKAHSAKLRASRLPNGRIELVVEDDGIGFDVDAAMRGNGFRNSFGIFSIRERLDVLGGSLSFDSSAGRGTRAVLEAPARLGYLSSRQPAPGRNGSSPRDFGVPSSGTGQAPSVCRVVLVCEEPVQLERLGRLFAAQHGVEVVGQALNGHDAVELASRLRPEVMVLSWPGSG
jgi:PAS domain S-box-containing protein